MDKTMLPIIEYPYSDDDEWETWYCPNCEEPHQDPVGIETHCRKCGTVVIVYIDGLAFDQGKKCPIS